VVHRSRSLSNAGRVMLALLDAEAAGQGG
jgi:hypothetical protein